MTEDEEQIAAILATHIIENKKATTNKNSTVTSASKWKKRAWR